MSDVTLVVGDEKIPAHRLVLAAQSKFFEVLLFDDRYNESKQKEVVLEVPARDFKNLLCFMYLGAINLDNYTVLQVNKLLQLADRFGLVKLEDALIEYLYINVSAENAVELIELASSLPCAARLEEKCWLIVQMIVEGIYDRGLFYKLSQQKLIELVQRNKARGSEIKLFQIAKDWLDNNACSTPTLAEEVFSHIKFDRMTEEQLLETVLPNGALGKEQILELIQNPLVYKAVKINGENYAVSRRAIVLTSGDNPQHLFKCNNNSFTTQIISTDPKIILVNLKLLCIVNNLEIKLKDQVDQTCSYSFYIEFSKDQETWEKVVDMSNSVCYGGKVLTFFFPEQITMFVKIVGLKSLHGGVSFGCNSLKVQFVSNPPPSVWAYICPKENVATNGKAIANFKDNNNEFQVDDVLLNGDYEVYDQHKTAFVAQAFKNGSLIVDFDQPYLLSSCRLRLWDVDGRKYKYIIETSADLKNFELVSDKTGAFYDGWQTATFSPRPICRFIISGLDCTVGEELRLIHFEAPANNVTKHL